jgi:hypothetical protein
MPHQLTKNLRRSGVLPVAVVFRAMGKLAFIRLNALSSMIVALSCHWRDKIYMKTSSKFEIIANCAY